MLFWVVFWWFPVLLLYCVLLEDVQCCASVCYSSDFQNLLLWQTLWQATRAITFQTHRQTTTDLLNSWQSWSWITRCRHIGQSNSNLFLQMDQSFQRLPNSESYIDVYCWPLCDLSRKISSDRTEIINFFTHQYICSELQLQKGKCTPFNVCIHTKEWICALLLWWRCAYFVLYIVGGSFFS